MSQAIDNGNALRLVERMGRHVPCGPSRAARESFAATQYERAPTEKTQRYWLKEMAENAAARYIPMDEWVL